MEEVKGPPPPYLFNYKSNPAAAPERTEGGIYPHLHILRNRKKILIAAIVFCLSVAFFVNITQRPAYRASTELILQPRDSRVSVTSPGINFFLADPTILVTQFRMIQGPHLAEKVLAKLETPENRLSLLDCFGIRPSKKRTEKGVFSERERRALLGAIQRSLSPRQLGGGVRIIAISAVGYNPQIVAKISNLASEIYVEMNYRSRMDSFRQNFLMISKTLAEIREKIKTSEMAYQKIDSEIRLLEAQKIYGDRHPLVIQLRRDIPELVHKLRRTTRNLETMEISQRVDLVPMLMKPNIEMEDLQKVETDLYNLRPLLEQEVSTHREMYNSVFHRLQEVQVAGGGSAWIDADIVEAATPPGRPYRPNKRANLILGSIVGLFLGVGLAFFQEYLDSSIRSLDDVRSYLRLFPLGMVPWVEFGGEKQSGTAKAGEGEERLQQKRRTFWLAGDNDIPLYVAEAYRIIRTNLAFGTIDSSIKVIQVTSAVKGEGKTTTAANLAVSLASGGVRTLLVDADMRRPTLHRILTLERLDIGLSDALTNGKSWQSAVVPTSIPNLFFMNAGPIPSNPAELLSSKRMRPFIDELKEHYDMIIFDSPPVISVADSAIIATRVDGTIMVSRSGFIPRHLCLQAKAALESVNAKLIGCVLNSVHTDHQPYYYRDYHRQYGRYDEDAAKAEASADAKESSSLASSGTFEKLKALQEPFLIFLSAGLSRLSERLKRERSKKESKSSVDDQ